MNPRLRSLLTIFAILMGLAGVVSAREAGSGLPFPGPTPQMVRGKGELSEFSFPGTGGAAADQNTWNE